MPGLAHALAVYDPSATLTVVPETSCEGLKAAFEDAGLGDATVLGELGVLRLLSACVVKALEARERAVQYAAEVGRPIETIVGAALEAE